MKILDFIHNLRPFEKDDVVRRENIEKAIQENISQLSILQMNLSLIPAYLNSPSVTEKGKIAINDILDLVKIKERGEDGIKTLIHVTMDLKAGFEAMLDVSESVVMFVKDGASQKQMAIMATVNSFISTSVLLQDVGLLLAYTMTESEFYFGSKEKQLRLFIGRQAHEISFHMKNKPVKIVAKISTFSDEKISSNDASKLDLPVSKWDGNVFLSIGKWWVDIQHERNEKRKLEAKLINLKLATLRSQNDEAINKQIEYLEDKLVILEDKIREYEDG